jgi:hypothetical protein
MGTIRRIETTATCLVLRASLNTTLTRDFKMKVIASEHTKATQYARTLFRPTRAPFNRHLGNPRLAQDPRSPFLQRRLFLPPSNLRNLFLWHLSP